MAAVLKTPLPHINPMTARQRKLFDHVVMEGRPVPDDASMKDLSPICEALDCPLWILFIPGLDAHPEILTGSGKGRFQRLVENYVAMDERSRNGIDVLAEHAARS